MNWLGSDPKVAREMDLDDIFQCRIQLLVIMASNFLYGVPLGEHQRRAMEHNARHIESECCMFSDSPGWRKQIDQYDEGSSLCHRLKLLSRMVTAVARGVSIGGHRKQVMRENLSAIDKLIGGNAGERNAINIRMLRLHR